MMKKRSWRDRSEKDFPVSRSGVRWGTLGGLALLPGLVVGSPAAAQESRKTAAAPAKQQAPVPSHTIRAVVRQGPVAAEEHVVFSVRP